MLAMLVSAVDAAAAPPRGGFRQGGPAGRGFNHERRPDLRQPNGPSQPGRPADAEPGGRRLSPEEREQLRQDIRDNGRQIYRGGRGN